MQPNIIIFGASGFIGTSLIQSLNNIGITPIAVSRRKPKAGEFTYVQWNTTDKEPFWINYTDDNSIIINLIGKSVDCRKTPETIDRILRSRIDSTRYIGLSLISKNKSPKHWIQMSTAHIYGDSELVLTETDITGYGLAPHIGREWENAFNTVCPKSTIKTILRTSFVIGKEGGAFPILKKLSRLGLGGTIGNGKQGMSWIHQYDFDNLVLQIIENEWSGTIIASSPHPVDNKSFMKTLRKSTGMPIGLPSPSCLIKLASLTFMNIDPEIALFGRYVKSDYLKEKEFYFKYSNLSDALKSVT